MTGREDFVAATGVSRETLARLDTYSELLERWNPKINLIAKSTLAHRWTRHFFDSAQILDVADPEPGLWADLGTGGGFPGLVIAILAEERNPLVRVVCVESDGRKAAFLRTVIRETGIRAEVVQDRIETLKPLGATTVSARALAPLPILLGYAHKHLLRDGQAVFLKGAGYAAEVAESLETWSFRLDTYPSKTDPSGSILRIGDIERV